MGHCFIYDKYLICDYIGNRKEPDDVESEDSAINRLFAICEGETSFSCNEVENILERYPNAARTVKRCASSFYPWGPPPWGDPMSTPSEKYPLHVACRNNAPIPVIRALLKAWPGALQTPAASCLPLEEACICAKSLDTIQLLVEEWPKSIEHYSPLHLALGICARKRPEVSLDIIQFLVHQWPESVKVSDKRVDVRERALVHHQSA